MMVSKWQWLLNQMTRKLWFRTSLFALLAVLTALLSLALNQVLTLPAAMTVNIDLLENILNILATSMLAVTTFSLNIMVSAYSAASAGVTPRATRLLMEDSTTQNALATFLGSFLFSLVGIIALGIGAYHQQGRIYLFVVTMAVIVMIILTLLRWIQHLSVLGRVNETTAKVEQALRDAIQKRGAAPWLGGHPWSHPEHKPRNSPPLCSEAIGYLQHVDMRHLNDLAEHHDCTIYLARQPGSFVYLGQPLAWICGSAPDSEDMLSAFSVRSERSYDQDPRFGLVVLAEIASRALSPAVNDSGTAIDVMGRAVRALALWGELQDQPPQTIRFPRLYVPALSNQDLFDDIFLPIAHDGCEQLPIQIRLQKSLLALASMQPARFAQPALRLSEKALELALPQHYTEDEKHLLAELSHQITAQTRRG
ncbi:DUF2254 domain-containing protein [Vibrio proteolyticus]|uniref:DUF2254 domain-containing protein n=1 Tax=Vibrio proteolyticus NBRC 13287 TaxID=1219065 RepID=U3A592_VIBPR|nr:DUF2254 domain-containing protein [Vibrio proteolyticus]GAD68855.1 hypothetical protein VPR01S_20_00350 [Vibrio proteolyticus NBRC 13287]